jgi:hypothetical protein
MAKARETWIDLWIVTIIHWNCTLSRIIVKTVKISTDLGQLSYAGVPAVWKEPLKRVEQLRGFLKANMACVYVY